MGGGDAWWGTVRPFLSPATRAGRRQCQVVVAGERERERGREMREREGERGLERERGSGFCFAFPGPRASPPFLFPFSSLFFWLNNIIQLIPDLVLDNG